MDWTTSLRAFGSLIVMTGLLALMSTNRKKIPWALVLKGMLIQFVFAFLILRVSFVANGFQAVGQVFVNILGYTREGSLFLFGSLISNTDSFGYIFAFQVLPTVIFFSAFTSLMYYWGILQKIVWVFAWIMRWTLKVSGAESLAAAGTCLLVVSSGRRLRVGLGAIRLPVSLPWRGAGPDPARMPNAACRPARPACDTADSGPPAPGAYTSL